MVIRSVHTNIGLSKGGGLTLERSLKGGTTVQYNYVNSVIFSL